MLLCYLTVLFYKIPEKIAKKSRKGEDMVSNELNTKGRAVSLFKIFVTDKQFFRDG